MLRNKSWLWVALFGLIVAILALCPSAEVTANTYHQTIPPVEDPYDDDANEDPFGIGDPIDAYSGEYWERALDLQIPGRGLAFAFLRSYRSRGNFKDILGHQWDHSYNQRIERLDATTLVYYDGQARRLRYTECGDGVYEIAGGGHYSHFLALPDGNYVLEHRDRTQLLFNALDGSARTGRLLAIADANDNRLELHYNNAGQLESVTDTLGRPIVFAYYATGNLAEVRDWGGRQLLFAYDEHDDLVNVTRTALTVEPSAGKSVQYAYLSGQTRASLDHNLVRVAYPGGSLSEPDLLTEYGTDASDLSFDRVIRQSRQTDTRQAASVHTFIYTQGADEQILVQTIDPRGQQTDFVVDGAGNLLRKVERAGSGQVRTTRYTRNEDGEPLAIVYPKGNVESFTYETDSPNRLSQGNLLSAVNIPTGSAAPVTTTFAYTPGATEVLSVTDPLGHVTAFGYDPAGNLVAITDALNATTNFTYTENGALTEMTDASGATTAVTQHVFTPPVARVRYTVLALASFQFDPSGSWDATTPTAELQVRWDWENDGLYDTLFAPASVIVHTYPDSNRHWLRLEVRDSDLQTATTTTVVQPVQTFLPQIATLGRPFPQHFYLPALMKSTGNATAEARQNPLPAPHVEQASALPLPAQFQPAQANAPAAVIDVRLVFTLTDAMGDTSNLTYDGYGNILEIKSPLGFAESYSYDAFDQLAAIAHPDGGATTFTYDAAGNRTSMTDANGNMTRYTYDAAGRRTSITDPLGNSTHFTYDPNDNLTTITDANDQVTTFEYDDFNQLILVRDPLGNTTRQTYDANGNRLSITDGNGNTTRFFYDGFDRLVEIRGPLDERTRFAYDANSNLIVTTDPLGYTTTYLYDALNRLTGRQDPLGNIVERVYDAQGRPSVTIDENGNATTYTYDTKGRLIRMRNALGNEISYLYDANGNCTGITNARGHTTSFTFDSANRLTSSTDPLGNVVHYSYDPGGRLITRTDALGQITSYTYDAGNHVVTIDLPGPDLEQYAYDRVGNLVEASNTHDPIRIDYDALHRPTRVLYATSGKAIQYTYDAAGNRTALTDADGGVTAFRHDASGRLVELTDPAAQVTSFAYNLAGRLARKEYPNGATATYVYDPKQRLTSVTHWDAAGNVLVDYRYEYDNVSNRTAMTSRGQTTQFAYDALYQLLRVTYPTGETIQYSYDAMGNRATMTTPAGATHYTYDDADRLIAAGAVSYEWDANGSLLTRVKPDATTTYAYDGWRRLTAVDDAAEVAMTYEHYPFLYLGQRSRTTAPGGQATSYLYDQANLVQEIDSVAGTAAAYDWAGGELLSEHRDGAARYFHADGVGSTGALSDAGAQTIARYQYDVFGAVLAQEGSAATPYLFTGQRLDSSTGLYTFGHRAYDAVVGRFLTRSPVYSIGSTAQLLNGYLFRQNNPISERQAWMPPTPKASGAMPVAAPVPGEPLPEPPTTEQPLPSEELSDELPPAALLPELPLPEEPMHEEPTPEDPPAEEPFFDEPPPDEPRLEEPTWIEPVCEFQERCVDTIEYYIPVGCSYVLNGVLKGGDYDTSREDRPDDKNYVWSHTEVRDGTVVTDEIWVCTYEKQIEVICDEPQLVCNY